MKKILLYSIVVILLGSCQKEDIFRYKLPTGRINGTLVYDWDNTPAKDIFIIFENTSSGSHFMTYTKQDGSFTLSRLADGLYSVVPTNDSLVSTQPVFVDVKGGETVNIGTPIKLRKTNLPVLTFNTDSSVVAVAHNAITVKAWVDADGSTVSARGFKFLLTSDPRDPSVNGTSRAIVVTTDPWDMTYFEKALTGLTANREYKIVAYVTTIRGGLTETGTRKTITLYSDQIIVTTLPTPPPPAPEGK